ncbi:hypothetical protein [Caenispirillum salinarum]|uniref:hypothetical protein n=1 Tax=Caenispirillum salinarum TaxID=859058 RepID=UPI00384C3D81
MPNENGKRSRFWEGLKFFLWLLLHAIIAAFAYNFLEARHWERLSGEIITALSLLCATVLVRLSRPFPSVDLAAFRKEEEFDEFLNILNRIFKYQCVVLVFGVAAIALVSVLPLAFGFFAKVCANDCLVWVPSMQRSFSAVTALAVSISVSRLYFLVKLDRGYLSIHAEAVSRAATRNRAEKRKNDAQNYKEIARGLVTGDSYRGKIEPPEGFR